MRSGHKEWSKEGNDWIKNGMPILVKVQRSKSCQTMVFLCRLLRKNSEGWETMAVAIECADIHLRADLNAFVA